MPYRFEWASKETMGEFLMMSKLFSAFYFCTLLIWLNHLHQIILQVILLFNIRLDDSANRFAFQYRVRLLLQIILHFYIWARHSANHSVFQFRAGDSARHSAFQYLGRIIPLFNTRADDSSRHSTFNIRADDSANHFAVQNLGRWLCK
jgi:hypothetical protein